MSLNLWNAQYNTLRAEFVSKFDDLNKRHSEITKDSNSIESYTSPESKEKKRTLKIIHINWVEDCILFKLNNHNSFKHTFEYFLAIFISLEEIDNQMDFTHHQALNGLPNLSAFLTKKKLSDFNYISYLKEKIKTEIESLKTSNIVAPIEYTDDDKTRIGQIFQHIRDAIDELNNSNGDKKSKDKVTSLMQNIRDNNRFPKAWSKLQNAQNLSVNQQN